MDSETIQVYSPETDPEATQETARETARESLVSDSQLRQLYKDVRSQTDTLHAPLTDEDCVIQSMPDASPTRWHLAHTSWFFETFVLDRAMPGRAPHHPQYQSLFNSYYNSVGQPFPRPDRGLLSRPSRREVMDYRSAVDDEMHALLDSQGSLDPRDTPAGATLRGIIELGLHHEQQHQELILTDIKHAFSRNPLHPVYVARRELPTSPGSSLDWIGFEAGLREIGHSGAGFSFDNERPRHPSYLAPFELASRPVTSAEYLEFIEDGGYRRPDLWLSSGWDEIQGSGWRAPLYWQERDGVWHQFTLAGLLPLEPEEPVCHVSYFEADAYARWANARLPNEEEWEMAVGSTAVRGNFAETGRHHPSPDRASDCEEGPLTRMYGDVWEWTRSSYSAYPEFTPAPGSLGEYNGKFMCNQYVLRGGSCASPAGHLRASYRNFFPPEARWQFSGIRLARRAK